MNAPTKPTAINQLQAVSDIQPPSSLCLEVATGAVGAVSVTAAVSPPGVEVSSHSAWEVQSTVSSSAGVSLPPWGASPVAVPSLEARGLRGCTAVPVLPARRTHLLGWCVQRSGTMDH